MRKLLLGFALSVLVLAQATMAESLPSQPKSVEHPGSDVYSYGVTKDVFQSNGRSVSVYLPDAELFDGEQFPVVVFGAGQASPEEAYEDTFAHLAGKGVAVIFPEYSNGFFDQNWTRMGQDYANLAQAAVGRYQQLDASRVVFSGHSKGGYVAGVSAGQEVGLRPQSVVLFQPAGFKPSAWSNVPVSVPVTIIYSDADTIIKREDVDRIFEASPVTHKQFLYVRSYPGLSADHFFPFSKKTWIGGRDGISPFHYYGVFGWLIGAAQDLVEGSEITNTFIYGDEATNTGVDSFRHEVTRSW
jgi:dienelactone hydrolase